MKMNKFQKKACFQKKLKIRPGMAFRMFDFDTEKSLVRSFSTGYFSDDGVIKTRFERANTFVLIAEKASSDSHHCVIFNGVYTPMFGFIQTYAILEKNNPIFSCLSSDSFSDLEKSQILSEPNMFSMENWLCVPATMSDEEVIKDIKACL